MLYFTKMDKGSNKTLFLESQWIRWWLFYLVGGGGTRGGEGDVRNKKKAKQEKGRKDRTLSILLTVQSTNGFIC
jgi:hypothetical protein